MTRLSWSAHLILMAGFLSWGVFLFVQGCAGGFIFDALMYAILLGLLVQLVVVAAGSKVAALDHPRRANVWTFSIWVGVSYTFILLRDTSIGLLFSLLVAVPGALLGLLLISVMKFLVRKVPFG